MKLVHQDKRGSIFVEKNGRKELTILNTHKNMARGGCIHTFKEEFTVISGIVLLFINSVAHLATEDNKPFLIQKNTSHYFIALTDSVVVEESSGVFCCTIYDKKDREIVNKINKLYD